MSNKVFLYVILSSFLILPRVAFSSLGLPRIEESLILSEPGLADRAENLVEIKIRSIEEMDKKLVKSQVSQEPWSDSYWPIYMGGLAYRYADLHFPSSQNWKKNAEYIWKNLGKGENLSPSEKYDLLVGDADFSLTRQMLEDGSNAARSSGDVETWMGICHGWAPASFMVPRPTHSIEVLAADGKTKIVFNPSDIKALTSLLWANARFPAKKAGLRCDEKAPINDSSGRPEKMECYDNNPGTWHLAIINRVGLQKRSLIMDTAYDYQVWNQPIVSYHYSYYNPETKIETDKLEKAQIPLNDFSSDKRKKFRSDNVAFVVGIVMHVTFTSETIPNASSKDDVSDDIKREVRFLYDLELDRDKNIIGGEWTNNNHPDFIWTPDDNANPESVGDLYLRKTNDVQQWKRNTAIPASWQRVAPYASQSKQPLARIVKELIEIAKK